MMTSTTTVGLNANHRSMFRVILNDDDDDNGSSSVLVWDSDKECAAFPDTKHLKQKIRDVINPDLSLGHSDRSQTQPLEKYQEVVIVVDGSVDRSVNAVPTRDDDDDDDHHAAVATGGTWKAPLPNAAITYCTGCRWLLRAAYLAQELTAAFGDEIKSLTLVPSRPPNKGGVFCVTVTQSSGGTSTSTLWDRAVEGRFPEPLELQERLSDVLNSHDNDTLVKPQESFDTNEDMDDDEAAKARQFFGVF